ncbi:Uncharacterised protein [Sebaldella termitidis]|uniref:Uncharacterized protein n=1 Tax=Sebaldella termitidis (strain ATCC 33386 / NCTC 11300) TaxID=526218 RepID=D1AS48_SEBTE|nr:hypothetical protein Sterm_4207 [Sebaldella termitidis ATCC 33386]SUI82994.1 Uncharacterised protein [Sebaldella termitidis]
MSLANLFNLFLQGLLILIIGGFIFLVYRLIFKRENVMFLFNLLFGIAVLGIVYTLLVQFIKPLTTNSFF